MTTQIEALKLALEALDSYGINDYSDYVIGKHETHIIDNAITAIKEALAQQSNEQVYPVAWDGGCVLGHCGSPAGCEASNCCRADYTTPPQSKEPEQEPVAWMSEHRFDELRKGFTVMTTLTKQRAFEDDVALYTTPPTQQSCSQRQCNVKPLTDEQIDAAIKGSKKVDTGYAGWVRDQRREFARAIEAAHGIKE